VKVGGFGNRLFELCGGLRFVQVTRVTTNVVLRRRLTFKLSEAVEANLIAAHWNEQRRIKAAVGCSFIWLLSFEQAKVK
jgi:hypothetical protein